LELGTWKATIREPHERRKSQSGIARGNPRDYASGRAAAALRAAMEIRHRRLARLGV
jgi:hypothetical protein